MAPPGFRAAPTPCGTSCHYLPAHETARRPDISDQLPRAYLEVEVRGGEHARSDTPWMYPGSSICSHHCSGVHGDCCCLEVEPTPFFTELFYKHSRGLVQDTRHSSTPLNGTISLRVIR